jgi:hypothetical protein
MGKSYTSVYGSRDFIAASEDPRFRQTQKLFKFLWHLCRRLFSPFFLGKRVVHAFLVPKNEALPHNSSISMSSNAVAATKVSLCKCGDPATMQCTGCKRRVCEDGNCGTDTVDGYLCGTYTLWGCARKYTTCDDCQDEKAINEYDLNCCEECGTVRCDKCAADHTCE